MIVYSQRKREVSTAEWIEAWNGRSAASREDAVDALIEIGEFEAGVADALLPDVDRLHPGLTALRQAAIAVARICRSGRGALPRIDLPDLPMRIETSVPEGYAYYDLHPDAYARAALRCCRERQAVSVVVIGVRSIGTSLSAIVAAAAQETGACVRSCTVRPRGHPFDRRLALGSDLAGEWTAHRDALFLVVDEGPGLSGSTFASVARALTGLGVAADRIVFLPGWDADGSTFLSETARETWRAHGRVVEPERALPGREISAGRWREVFCGSARPWPAVHPQHERRKSLDASRLWKFAGVGKYGRDRYDRAAALSDAGFTPRPLEIAGGFLASEFVAGRPLDADDGAPALVTRIRGYLEFVAAEFPASRPLPLDDIESMARANIEESLGSEWSARASELLACLRPAAEDGKTVAIDGRMFPHEWLDTGDGYIKTDALDHHDDHFFPGPQDIAWDAAMASIEFGIPPRQLMLIHSDKLSYYSIAYLAFRIGYCSLAAETLGHSEDGRRFRALVTRYGSLLPVMIEMHSSCPSRWLSV